MCNWHAFFRDCLTSCCHKVCQKSYQYRLYGRSCSNWGDLSRRSFFAFLFCLIITFQYCVVSQLYSLRLITGSQTLRKKLFWSSTVMLVTRGYVEMCLVSHLELVDFKGSLQWFKDFSCSIKWVIIFSSAVKTFL